MTRFALILVTVMSLILATQACDPSLTTDFFVPTGVNAATLNGSYFTSVALQNGIALTGGAKFGAITDFSNTFPALTGLSISSALFQFAPGGINPPHTHPRGSETLFVIDGELTVGLIDSSNKLYTAVLRAFDIFVFPVGLVHYQINLSSKPVTAYAAFSSSSPGLIVLPANLFDSGIPVVVLADAFDVPQNTINQLEAPYKT